YATKWIPALPDIDSSLRAGGRVAEVGCGLGWSSIALARGFPKARIDAIDPDEASIETARANAQEAGVAERIRFHLATVEDSAVTGPYDLVTAFECIHDMPYPVKALRRVHDMVAPDGAVLIADEGVGDTLEENRNFLGRLIYNFSVLHCLPQAMVFPNSAGIGCVMRPSTLRSYAEEAGYSKVEVLPVDNPMWRLYRLTP
ncbi:MAG: class I SAM-dependent methyltransferase, partial [Dehalococcoidia bacterium]